MTGQGIPSHPKQGGLTSDVGGQQLGGAGAGAPSGTYYGAPQTHDLEKRGY